MDYVLVSILMTAYNREEYIAEAIESVLASSFTDFELIIADDGSTDATVDLVKSYLAKDQRIKLIVNERNLGQFANRNKAAAVATGKYIKYVDSDDIIYPYSLQVMMDAMLRFPQAGLGFCVKYKDSEKPYPYLLAPATAFLTHYLQGELLMIGPSGLIIKKEAFDAVMGFEEYGMPSDNHLTLKIAGRYPVVALQRDLFWWRLHTGQAFSLNRKNYQLILKNYLFNTDILQHYSPLQAKENRKIVWNQKKIFYVNLINLCFKKIKPALAVSLFRQYLKQKKI